MPTEEELFIALVREIVWATDRLNMETCVEEDLPTAAELARKLNYRLEAVKKKLRILKEQGLVHAVSLSPKRYRFDHWALRTLEPESVLYALFCEPDSLHYIPSEVTR
jgi:transcription initiation factor IIE alpha subunit